MIEYEQTKHVILPVFYLMDLVWCEKSSWIAIHVTLVRQQRLSIVGTQVTAFMVQNIVYRAIATGFLADVAYDNPDHEIQTLHLTHFVPSTTIYPSNTSSLR